MRRPFLLLVAVAMTAALLARGATPVAHACVPPVPFPTIEQQVAGADLIFTGTVTATFIDPPLDPNTPDEFIHVFKITLEVSEYLRGTGPSSFTYDTNTYYFAPDGTLVATASDCEPWGQPPVGAPYLVLAGPDGVPRLLGTAPLNEVWGQNVLEQVMAALNSTPTPSPSASPIASATPAKLPGTGDIEHGDSPLVPIAAAVVTLPLAFLLRAAFVRARRGGAP